MVVKMPSSRPARITTAHPYFFFAISWETRDQRVRFDREDLGRHGFAHENRFGVCVTEGLDQVEVALRQDADQRSVTEHGKVTNVVLTHHCVGLRDGFLCADRVRRLGHEIFDDRPDDEPLESPTSNATGLFRGESDLHEAYACKGSANPKNRASAAFVVGSCRFGAGSARGCSHGVAAREAVASFALASLSRGADTVSTGTGERRTIFSATLPRNQR